MKRAALLLVFLFLFLNAFTQVLENKSGIQKFNISKKGAEINKSEADQRALADVTPPVIKIQTPDLKKDSVPKTEAKMLTVRGTVEDAGGIFEVWVNDVEAKVSAEGIFLADVPLAAGKKTHIRVRATDISRNSSYFDFNSERTVSAIPEPVAAVVPPPVPVKPANTYSINFITPSTDGFTTPTNKFLLKACIKSSAKINRLFIYRNGSFVNGYLSDKITRKGDCDFSVEETIPLNIGKNDIRLEFIAGADTVSKNVNVEYSFYAARNFALLIGNEKYQDPNINELSDPIKDATALYNTLTTNYNFEKENVIFLKNPTKGEIIGQLNGLRSKIGPTDNLLIFYAGHGVWDEEMGVGYWLPKDAEKGNPVNWIPNTDITNYLGALKTQHTLLIADACFSGGIFKTREAFSTTFAFEKLYELHSRKAITSGTLTVVPDKSVFFQYLLKNLKDNTNEYFSAEELFSKMRIAVINNSSNIPQFGTIQNVGDEGGDFIFIRRRK
jgi:hypothetical protein